MSIDYTFRPIQQWPGKLRSHSQRKRSPFACPHNRNLVAMARELEHQRARNVVIQLALDDRDLRLDGLPRKGANPSHPGVILTFEKPGKKDERATTLNFPCDTYTTWQDNLRAIVLALDALRRVDRYGVTQNNEQYRGWAQLPPPGGLVTPPPMSVEEASEFVARAAGCSPPTAPMQNTEAFRSCYRDAAKKLHPDSNGGDQLPSWALLQTANEILKRHHGIL